MDRHGNSRRAEIQPAADLGVRQGFAPMSKVRFEKSIQLVLAGDMVIVGQLAPHARMFIYYGGSRRLVGGIVPQMEAVAIEFLTADEVPAPARK